MSNLRMSANPRTQDICTLEGALHLVDKIQVHQELCREIVTLALQTHHNFHNDADWNRVTQELNDAINEWARLSPVESFLKCDIIAGKLASLHRIIQDFCGTSSKTSIGLANAFHSDGNSLIPPLLAMFSSPDALDAFYALPVAHTDTAISLLYRVLDALPSESSSLRELILGCLKNLEDREVDLNLDIPDLSDEISLLHSQPVSSGQYGDVYLAKRGNDLVAVRILKTLHGSDVRGHKALERDLKRRVSLLHPNLIPFYGICSTNLGTCMVSSHMPNGNANVYLECHPEANAIALLAGAANGLQYLHSCWPSIAHGDVRGANILVSSAGEALLADYGLGHIVEERPDPQAPYGLVSSLNAQINFAGIRWAAPEILCKDEDLRNIASSPSKDSNPLPMHQSVGSSMSEDALIEVVTPMSDVWSFGMTVYELLTNRTPFYQHARVETVIAAIRLNERPLPPTSQTQVRAEWQPELWSLMQGCWVTDRRQRLTMDVLAKRMTLICGKSVLTHESLERARSPSVLGDHRSPTPSQIRPTSALRTSSRASPVSPSAPPTGRVTSGSSLSSRILRASTSGSSLSARFLRASASTPSSNKKSPSPTPTVASNRPKSPNQTLSSYGSANSLSRVQERKDSPPSSLSTIGSSSKARDDDGSRDNLHPFSVTISGTSIEWSKLSLTQKRVFLHNCRAEGGSPPPYSTGKPAQTVPSSPPRSLSPGSSSRHEHHTRRPDDSSHVLMPVRASPLTSEAISMPSKLTRNQLSRIIIPESTGFTAHDSSSSETSLPTSGVDEPLDRGNGVQVSRSRASAPFSVHSNGSHSTSLSNNPLTVPSDQSFEIIPEDEDSSTLDPRTVDKLELMSSPSNESSENPAFRLSHLPHPNDWMDEAFAETSLVSVSTTKPNGYVPEDILSSSSDLQHSDSAHQYPPGLDIRISEPEPRPLYEDIQECRERIELLMREEADFISTPPDRGFLHWVAQVEGTCISPIIAQQAEMGMIEAYKNVAKAHNQLRESLISPDELVSLDEFSELFEQCQEGLSPLSPVYRDYVEALSNLNDILANALGGEINKLRELDSSKCVRLSTQLRTPFQRLSSIATSLRAIVGCLSRAVSYQTLESWNNVANGWLNFSLQTPLLSWQASLGREALVSFESKDMYPSGTAKESNVLYRDIQFRIIEKQSKFVGSAHSAGKRLDELWIQVPAEIDRQEISVKISELYRMHLLLLEDLYRHQRENHPQIPSIFSIIQDSLTQWREAYLSYASLLEPVLDDGKVSDQEMSTNRNELKGLLTAPISYLRDLVRDVKALLDATGDRSTDIEPAKLLIQGLETLFNESRGEFENATDTEDVGRLIDTLAWETGLLPINLDLNHISRRILHKGILHYPVDPSGTRVSIDDRGSSVQVLLILLDNCLLVTDPIVRHGVERLRVKAALHLDDIFLPDSETTRASQQQIFLLDSENGKRIASPVLLRYRDHSAPRTIAPRPRTTSTASALGIRVEDGMHLLFPKELLLLANSNTEGAGWRSKLSFAKLSHEEIGVKPAPSRNMFKIVPTTTLPFEPSSSAEFFLEGKKATLICAEGAHGGIFVQNDKNELLPCITAIQAKQCCVVDEMRIALVLVARSLWALRLEELVHSEVPHPVIVKNHASIFRIGYQRGQLLLVVAYETAKGTTVKWYTTSRMSRPSLPLSAGIFGRSKKLFRLLGEQEIHGMIHGLEVLDSGIVTMGVSGFQLLIIDQGNTGKIQDLPQIRAGASSDAAQRCRTSKALGAIRSENEILLCYSDFGVYVSTTGDIVGRPIDWTISRVSSVTFAPPYFFLVAENHVEVRLVETGRRLETLEGNFFKMVRGVERTCNATMNSPVNGESMADFIRRPLEDDGGLIQLAAHCQDSETNVSLVELQMEVLDLAP